MLVKQRLYKRHRDLLIQLDRAERLEKLEETVGNVEEGYDGLLKAFENRETQEGGNGDVGREEDSPARKRGKRKFTVFEDEDEENEDQEGEDKDSGEVGMEGGEGNGDAKKMKI